MRANQNNSLLREPFFWLGLVLAVLICAVAVVLTEKEAQQEQSSALLPAAQGARESESRHTALGQSKETMPVLVLPEPSRSEGSKSTAKPTIKPTEPAESVSLTAKMALPATVARAKELLAGMSLEQKVGQLFIGRVPKKDAVEDLRKYPLGGYILFARDFAGLSAEQIQEKLRGYQKASKTPLFLGVDEEGGEVNRLSINPKLRAVPFWAPQDLYKEGGFALVRSDTKEKSQLLRRLGLNLNFAPVCDVPTSSKAYIFDRSFGTDPKLTAEYVKTVVSEMNRWGVGSVLKHFPGYGDNGDTHTDIVHDKKPRKVFETRDFLPFEAGIKAGAGMVLVAHNIVESLDPKEPASLSPIIHKLLREQLGFTGVIITDDLAMQGVLRFAGKEDAAVLAIQAGNDLLCSTDFTKQYPAVLAAVKEGRISAARLEASVLRILELKLALGIVR